MRSFVSQLKNFIPVPGFIGLYKENETLYINKKTGQIHFFNEVTNIWRTTIKYSKTQLERLAKNNFHLFPEAGNSRNIE